MKNIRPSGSGFVYELMHVDWITKREVKLDDKINLNLFTKKHRIEHCITLWVLMIPEVIGTMNKEVNVSGLECFTMTK